MMKEKKKNGIIQLETELSHFCSKTVNYEKFKDFIKKRYEIGIKVRPFYEQILFRKFKLRTKIYRRKSEDKFINRMKETFGKPDEVIVVIGVWGVKNQSMMKNHKPTLGSGLNKIISKHFTAFLVAEDYTSKRCCNCAGRESSCVVLVEHQRVVMFKS